MLFIVRIAKLALVLAVLCLSSLASICLAEVPVLNENQTARLTNGTQDSVYTAVSFGEWCAFQETSMGLIRYAEAKKNGEDPSKYLKWIEKDREKREEMVSAKRLFLVPYNTKVKILKYKEDNKAQQAAFMFTGKRRRYGTFEIEILEGDLKGRKLWTEYAVDVSLPANGDPAYIIDSTSPESRVAVAFDEGQLSMYRDSLSKGNDAYASTLKKIKFVFEVDPNTEVAVVDSNDFILDKQSYFQVRITKGEYAGKLVWCPASSLTLLKGNLRKGIVNGLNVIP